MSFDWKKISWTKPNYTKENIIIGMLAVFVGGSIWYYFDQMTDGHSPSGSGSYSNLASQTSVMGAATALTKDPGIKWVTFRDTREGAFTIEVPQGWNVSGGIVRRGSVDYTFAVEAISPDQTQVLFFGDPSIPVYTMPNMATNLAGKREGDILAYPGASMVIAQYQPGNIFAANWGRQRFSRFCSDVNLRANRPKPNSSQNVTSIQFGAVQSTVNVGEAIFTCNLNGRHETGYISAATQINQAAMGSGIWVLLNGEGFISPPGKTKEVGALLSKMVGSFRLNPQWLAQQQDTTMKTSEINTQTNEAISRSINETFSNSQKRLDSVDDFDRAIRGTDLFNDPVDGQVELENKTHQYRTDTGERMGTDRETDPPVSSQEILRARH